MEASDPDPVELCKQRGASTRFLRVLEAETPYQNTTKMHVETCIEHGRTDEQDLRCGSFATALWEGNMTEAVERADPLNMLLLYDVFPKEMITGWMDEWQVELATSYNARGTPE